MYGSFNELLINADDFCSLTVLHTSKVEVMFHYLLGMTCRSNLVSAINGLNGFRFHFSSGAVAENPPKFGVSYGVILRPKVYSLLCLQLPRCVFEWGTSRFIKVGGTRRININKFMRG